MIFVARIFKIFKAYPRIRFYDFGDYGSKRAVLKPKLIGEEGYCIKHKFQTVWLVIIFVLSFLFAAPILPGTTPTSVAAEPIPNGCPGSANPASPPPAECATIPIGCPGSSQSGPVASPPKDCPYQVPPSSIERYEPEDCDANNPDAECEFTCDEGDTLKRCVDENPIIVNFINPAINFLAAGFGIIVTIMIIVGGIQYAASAGNPQTVTDAKKRITNAILALVAFGFVWSFLQWIVPGGIF